MRRAALALLAVATGGCSAGDPPTVADVEDCLRDKGAEVTRPARAEQVSPDLPSGTRYVTRGFWEGRGQALFFRAPDNETARAVEDRLAALQDEFGPQEGDVRRDGVYVVQLDITRQQGQDAFNCAR